MQILYTFKLLSENLILLTHLVYRQVHIKGQSCLRFSDKFFWEKLFFALPDASHDVTAMAYRPEVNVALNMRELAGSDDDVDV